MKKRLIARLDIRAPNLIKPIRREGVRSLGDPHQFAVRYDQEGIDEILYLDAVASLYSRGHLLEILEKATREVFTPVTAGGGIKTVEDARALLLAGADKVALNTEATKRAELISEIANKFGSQCMVLQIDAKRRGDRWEAWRDGGREPTGLDVINWAKQGVGLGAGEILLTSIDFEGTKQGQDVDLISAVAGAVSAPVVASGGVGSVQHVIEAFRAGADAVAMARVLHYKEIALPDVRWAMKQANIPVRE